MAVAAVFLCFMIPGFSLSQNNTIITGKVTDRKDNPVELVNVSIKGYPYGAVTDHHGDYKLKMPYITSLDENFIEIVYSCIGYKTKTLKLDIDPSQNYNNLTYNVKIDVAVENIEEIAIREERERNKNLIRINPKIVNTVPELSGSIEGVIKTLPGVASSNELSSQYSVRGGNYDENLVYVNGIEIYRPMLIRSGQQEGLSFVNSDLISSIVFSAGGFDAKYGDKMSSVLDISYKKPRDFSATASASLLGGSAHIEDASSDYRFTYIAGARYKSAKYVLNSLETAGEYDPQFFDLQTYITYQLSDNIEIGALGYFAKNEYKVVPSDRETTFGTFNEALKFKVYFDGQEVDEFTTAMGALSFNFQPHNDLPLKLITSGFQTTEQETFDILGQYLLNEVDKSQGEGLGDSVANIGIGSYLKHARNYL